MYTLLIVALMSIAVSLHELGHAFFMRKYGIPMQEICVLGIGPKLLEWKWRRIFGEVPMTIRLIPLSAFVKIDKDHKCSDPVAEEHMLSAGVSANLIVAMLLVVIGVFLEARSHSWEQIDSVKLGSVLSVGTSIGLIGMLMWRFPRFAAYSVACIGIIAGSVIAWGVCAFIKERFFSGQAGVPLEIGGPVMLAQQVSEAAEQRSVAMCFIYAGAFSLNLAMVNCLPLLPLDGSRVALSMFGRWAPSFMSRHADRCKISMFLAFVIFIGIIFGSDISSLIQKIIR